MSFRGPQPPLSGLGLTEGQVGTQILQYGTFAQVVIAFGAGWVIDKLGTVRAMVIGFFFIVVSMLAGFNPFWSSSLAGHFHAGVTPAHLLALAYILNMVANAFCYSAALVFVMSSVHRKDVATFCACSGAFNLLVQFIIINLSGGLIKYVFGGNYGFCFIMALVLATAGITTFAIVNRWNRELTTAPMKPTDQPQQPILR